MRNGPRPAPYNPRARDADHDGTVQEGTIWERPDGTRFVDNAGRDITSALAGQVAGSYIADDRGGRVDYTPSWQRATGPIRRPNTPGDPDHPGGGLPTLADLGHQQISDSAGTIGDIAGTVEGPPESDVPVIPPTDFVPAN